MKSDLDLQKPLHENGVFGSWEIIDENTAKKRCDLSFFKYRGSGVSQKIKWFFDADNLEKGESRSLIFVYNDIEYKASVQRTDNTAGGIRIFWDSSLGEMFQPFHNDGIQHSLLFMREDKDRFTVKFQNEERNKAWLLIWNRANFEWPDYSNSCKGTQAGEIYSDSWSCASKKPAVGDEVYLMKVGDEPRGIVGHGYVAKSSYERDHYDPARAAEGKKERCIGISYDLLLDYEHEKILSASELKENAPDQHWSTQSSGIEIKDEVLPVLRKMWNELSGETKKYLGDEEWWPSISEYDPGITKDKWLELLADRNVTYDVNLSMLKMLLLQGGAATCTKLAQIYGGTASSYIGLTVAFGKRIQKKTNCPICNDDGTQRMFTIPFQGKSIVEDGDNRYCWRLRDELREALKTMDLSNVNINKMPDTPNVEYSKNTILYGPPGTGKTYNSIIYAVAICTNQPVEVVKKEPYRDVLEKYRTLKESGRIAFTTFHQSYGYEEFIEGIKPVLGEETDRIGYTIENGVFKEFCNSAKQIKVSATKDIHIKTQPRIWGMILGGTGLTKLKQECFDNNQIRLGWHEVKDEDVDGDYIGDDIASWNAKHMVYDFKNTMEIGDLVLVEKNNHSIDAIGIITGEYEYDAENELFPRKRTVEWLVKGIDQDMIQFLPNGRKQLSRFSLFAFDYLGMDVITNILNEHSKHSIVEVEQEHKPYVFIIDEINRGNISKIFGELITLIEDNKRSGATEAMEAVLPYSGEMFSVPDNVYILGTMNTADRSIALMDTALRRRFEFVEMMPDPEVLKEMGVGIILCGDVELNIAKMLEIMNTRIEYLFDREHTIGHAFFTKLAENPSIETLAAIFEKRVIPLLQEYFYEDYEKIQLVLGDNAKTDNKYKFILDLPIKETDIFKGKIKVDLPDKGFRIQMSALMEIESYKQIGEGI